MTTISNHPPQRREPQKQTESTREVPKEKFEEWLKVAEVDDTPKRRDLFKLIEEEEKDDVEAAAIAVQLRVEQCVEGAVAQEIRTLSIELEELFEKMAAAMIVATTACETETTLFFDNPSSFFYGTRITLREFRTAPRSFNVEIASHAAAIQCIEEHKQALLKAFEEKDFNFGIHRLETELQDRPIFHRKEQGET